VYIYIGLNGYVFRHTHSLSFEDDTTQVGIIQSKTWYKCEEWRISKCIDPHILSQHGPAGYVLYTANKPRV